MYNIQVVKQIRKLEQLENLSYFDTETIAQITELKGNTLYKDISRWVNQKVIIKLKRGVYTTSFYYSTQSNNSYLEFISNKLRYPSYLSLEYVLSKYQILTESVYAYTAITQKSPRSYTNNLGTFSYRNIGKKLFTGYEIIKQDGFDIAIATKPKALFDYLYLKLYRNFCINKSTIDDLRLNLDEFTKQDIKEFSRYCDKSKITKISHIDELIFN